MESLDLVKLTALMERTSGSPEVKIGLIDGPVLAQHADGGRKLARDSRKQRCHVHAGQQHRVPAWDFCCRHLVRKAQFPRPRHLPKLYRPDLPIFAEATSRREHMPSAMPSELAAAIIECIDAGARVNNLSLALTQPSTKGSSPWKKRSARLSGAVSSWWRRRVIKALSTVPPSPAIHGSSRWSLAIFEADRGTNPIWAHRSAGAA